MAQSNLRLAPDRIMFSSVLFFAGLGSDVPSRFLKFVMQWVNEGDLPLYTHGAFPAVNASNEIKEVYDEDREVQGLHLGVGNSDILDGAQDELIIEYGTYLSTSNTIAVSRFKYKGTSYHPSDELGMTVRFPRLDIDDCFCKRSELKTFLDKLDSRDESTTIDRPTKKCSMQERREIAFKTWLATKAKANITEESQYQECYETIDEPTQNDVWTMLQKTHHHLFATGKEDFFKNQKIIRFKDGTGKGRTST